MAHTVKVVVGKHDGIEDVEDLMSPKLTEQQIATCDRLVVNSKGEVINRIEMAKMPEIVADLKKRGVLVPHFKLDE